MPSPRARKINDKCLQAKLCMLLKLNKLQPIKPECDPDPKSYYQLTRNTGEKEIPLKTTQSAGNSINNLVSSVNKLQGQWWG